MNEIVEGLWKALELIFTGNPALVAITFRAILVSGSATLISALWSIPLGVLLGLRRFRGRFLIKGFFNAMLGIPTVTLGLILYLIFSKSGPLGALHLLYTPTAITIGQAILITPVIVSFTINSIEMVDPEIRELTRTLGASEFQSSITVLRESLSGTFLAVTASFNRAIAELGVALMVGGNIRGVTRVLTTTIALETARGEIVLSIALALILLFIVFGVSLTVNLLQRHLGWSGGR